ncbi:MAG: cyclase family protein [Acidimicrobiales bacterium]|nr:cyclase family protein [Acidimicrobiales bacterium]
MTALPTYAQLAPRTGAPARSAWGLWGDDDRLGCWNKIDQAATRRGIAAARRGIAYSLTLDYDPDLAVAMGRTALRQEIRPIAGIAFDDVLHEFNTQGTTQWDGFRHFPSAAGFYNGLAPEEHGVDHWARRGLATRGVLVDVARWREAQGRPIDVAAAEIVPLEEVMETLDSQGVTVEPGDILFFRWGWYEWILAHPPGPGEISVPGLERSERVAAQLWDWHVAAVAGDAGVDPLPPPGAPPTAPTPTGDDLFDPAWCFAASLHFVIPWFGLSIGEFFDLRHLAAGCAADADWTFLVTVAPMNHPAGVATTGNAVAVR